MAATATITLLMIGGDGEPAVEMHPGVRAAVAAAAKALDTDAAVDRAAIAVGEATPESIESSPAYADALALFNLAQPGDLLLSATAAAVLGPHRHRLVPRGEGATAVQWQAGARVAPLPSFLARAEQFVGRAAELEQVMAIVDGSETSLRQRVVLRGDAGIGKTSLAGAVASRARQCGFAVLAGRCAEELAVSYQPLAEALQPVIDSMDVVELTERVGPTAPYLAALFPKVGGLPRADGAEARELLHHALRALLRSVVEKCRTLLVIDDIQWAPRPTLELIDELRGDVPSLLLLGTQRVGDGWKDPWPGDDGTTIVDVGPLSFDDTLDLVALHSGGLAGQSDAVRDIHRRSAGNPFFAEELAMHIGQGGTASQLPLSVREVVLRRVGVLAPDAAAILGAAAVIGAPFDADLLARITGTATDEIGYLLEDARRAALLVARRERFDFKHALARDALYESLTSARRRLLHARIADLIDGPPELIAYHLAASATREMLDRVSAAALKAADTEAPWAGDPRPVLRRALDALKLDPRPRRDRAELLSALSVAEYNAGERDAPWQAAERAALEARTVGDLGLLVKAISNMGYTLPNDGPFDRFVALAEETLALHGDHDEVVAVVTQVLASHLSWRGNDIGRATKLIERGLPSAARLDDDGALRQALAIRAEVLAGTPHIEERLRIGEQYVRVHERAGLSSLAGGYAYGAAALLAAGRRDDYDEACDIAFRIAEERPWWHTEEIALLLRSCQGLLDGELLPTLMMISPKLGTFADEGISPFVAQAALIWRENGRTGDLIPLIAAISPSESTRRLVPSLLMLAHAELGHLDEARELLAEVSADDYASLYTSYATGVALAMAAEACWHLGDADEARVVARHLRPYGGQLIVIPPCSAAFGPADYFLGLAADAYGDTETAVARLEAALALSHRVRAPLLRGHAALALAHVIASSDPARAESLRGETRATAQRLGAARLKALLDQA